MSDPAVLWGLPPGFEPVRQPIPDAAKQVLLPMLSADEPVLVMIANEGDSIT